MTSLSARHSRKKKRGCLEFHLVSQLVSVPAERPDSGAWSTPMDFITQNLNSQTIEKK